MKPVDKKYYPRLMDDKINNLLNTFGAICIEGPKWCGKTWSGIKHCKSNFMLHDPSNNFQNRALAKNDVNSIFEGEYPLLIDEWQEVPSIWDATRYKVDEIGKNGLFILTGSSTPRNKGIMHSGAGRIAKLHLRTMSLSESEESSNEISLSKLINNEYKSVIKNKNELSLDHIANFIVRGGWPQVIVNNQNDAIAKEYIKAILDDDLQKLEGKRRNKSKMELLLKSLARNESTTASVQTIMNDISNVDAKTVSDVTITDYIEDLKNIFLIDDINPFNENVRSSYRLKQKVKHHFVDPSIPCALLNLDSIGLKNNLYTFGFLFESLVLRDLKIYAEKNDFKIYHYQDYNNKEVDAIIELKNGDYAAIEIKLGAHQIDEAAKNLCKLKNDIDKENVYKSPTILAIICGMGNAFYKREDNVYVIPINMLTA